MELKDISFLESQIFINCRLSFKILLVYDVLNSYSFLVVLNVYAILELRLFKVQKSAVLNSTSS